MLRPTDATPCPGGLLTLSSRDSRDATQSLGGEDTTDIDFTTAFRASLRATGPRRRQTAIGARKRGTSVNFAIHEDQECHGDVTGAKSTDTQPTATEPNKSILAQPAHRFRPRVCFTPGVLGQLGHHEALEDVPNQGHKGLACNLSRKEEAVGRYTEQQVIPDGIGKIKRPARRGTVYLPDDTTMPSVYMGIFSPIKNVQYENHAAGQNPTVELTGIAAQRAQKRESRKSLAAAPARRAPLQRPLRAVQESAAIGNIPGRQTGKENVPPGSLEGLREKTAEETNLLDIDIFKTEPKTCRTSTANLARRPRQSTVVQGETYFDLHEPRMGFQARRSTCRPAIAPKVLIGESKGVVPPKSPRQVSQTRPAQKISPKVIQRSRPLVPRTRPEKVPAKLTIPDLPPVRLQQQYPILSEDISNPAVYEDNWLAHQAIAITQLVNNLFAVAEGSNSLKDARLLRFELLELYQDKSFSLLYKRLQASLLYGALTVSKDVLARASRLKDDLGVREAFLNLWLETYDLTGLKAALEVIIGRECSSFPKSRGGRHSDGQPDKSLKRSVRKYIETFLIRNEDAIPEPDSTNHAAWAYQRTLLRSLLLVKLLDKVKTTPNVTFSGCLFLSTSPHKSSSAVVQALANMLNPAVGDIVRPLSHLDYSVGHVQYPLEEFQYRIENLAVDLRDGVRLTRLVELLLYPSASDISREREADATATVTMPTGEVFSLIQGEQDWPLSQHLKIPCLGRATKLFNVQVALSALAGVKGMEKLVADTRAEDIVDGFREKSVALLWGLTGKWGLGGLIDWKDVRHEIERLQRNSSAEQDDFDEDELDDGFEKYKELLKGWASAVAGCRGLQVNNLTTSFSDGKIFAAIVDEYEPYIQNGQAKPVGKVSLDERLVALGCSCHFAKLFSLDSCPGGGRIFDRDFTVAALAFLCSRLLSASRRPRAAIVIQRAWRRWQDRVEALKRGVAKRLATECMTVILTRERLLWAKKTILGCWRRYRGRGHPRGLDRLSSRS